MKRVLDWLESALDGDVLIASDFDGTLTGIVPRADDARLDARTVATLRELARAPRTHVAILSGRTLTDLAPRLPELAPIWVSSDHGSVVVDPERRTHRFDEIKYDARLAGLRARGEDLARVFRGAEVEVKPRSVALHFRAVAPQKHAAIVEMFRLSCAAHRAQPLVGRMVVEGCFGVGDKGVALRHIVSKLPSGTSVIYVGDDVTDEPALAFANGHPRGLALYIVSDERAAPRTRVDGWLAGPSEWLEILEAMAVVRRQGLAPTSLTQRRSAGAR